MLVISKILYKNYLSTGNHPVEIVLDKYRRQLFTGTNGHGKSTMSSALFFGLFGKDIRGINKNNLINSINGKGALVEVTLSTNGKEYLIRRGIKPNIFEIHEDGVKIEKLPSANEFQDYLEKNILRQNFKSFKQIVCLGTDSFIPFMKLSAADRREMVEDLLGLSVFSDMSDLLKKRIVAINSDITAKNSSRDVAVGKMDVLTSQKIALEQKAQKDNQKILDSITSIESDIVTKKERLTLIENKLQSVEEALAQLAIQKAEYDNLQLKVRGINNLLAQSASQIKFFADNHTCPTCTQGIQDGHKNQILSEIESERSAFQKEVDEHQAEISKLEKEVSVIPKLEKGRLDLSNEKTRINTEISLSGTNISSLRSQLQDSDTSDIMGKIDGGINFCQTTIAIIDKELSDLTYKKEVMVAIQPMLKDSGIKAKIVSHYIPLMNQLINEFLQKMDFYVQFELDEEFNESIKSRYRDDFQYANFSAGEKQRIDLAILFAWRHIARMRNSLSTNLLILDEIGDSSLDQEGVENLVKILDSLEKTNVVVITHNNETKEQIGAEAVVEFKKKNHFTTASLV